MMNSLRSRIREFCVGGLLLLFGTAPGIAQVGPAEIRDPRLRAVEQVYLQQLVEINRAIGELSFPFTFRLSRYAALDPDQQIGADARGLEFVNFHDRLVLKVTGNYNAAFSADLLTPNQRANRVFDEVVVPMIRVLAGRIPAKPDFDGIGFEVAYHTRLHSKSFTYEGKEILAMVLEPADVRGYAGTVDEMKRQGILNRSEIYLDGKPLGLVLGERDPFDVAGLLRSAQKSSASPSAATSTAQSEESQVQPAAFREPPPIPAGGTPPVTPSTVGQTDVITSPPPPANLQILERKYRPQLDDLGKLGTAKFHFVDFAPPSFVNALGRIAVQVTVRNPNHFEQDATSIYKRAAESFDLFLARELKPILALVPDSDEFDGLDVTILNELVSKSGSSSEALEFVFPLKTLRRFVAAEMTNQELINQSVVLVNGVRIALDLQRVE